MSSESPSSIPTTTKALFAQIMRRMLIATAVVTVLGVGIGWFAAGSAGLWGGLLGGLIGLIFCGTTVASMILGEGKSPQYLAIVLLGGWLLKMLVIIILLVVIRDLTFYDRYVLAGTLGAIVVASLVIETMAVRNARIPLVDVPSA